MRILIEMHNTGNLAILGYSSLLVNFVFHLNSFYAGPLPGKSLRRKIPTNTSKFTDSAEYSDAILKISIATPRQTESGHSRKNTTGELPRKPAHRIRLLLHSQISRTPRQLFAELKRRPMITSSHVIGISRITNAV